MCRSEPDTKPGVVLIVTCRPRPFPFGAAWPNTSQLTTTGVAPPILPTTPSAPRHTRITTRCRFTHARVLLYGRAHLSSQERLAGADHYRSAHP